MGITIGIFFLTFFSWVNAFLWGDDGYTVHLMGSEYPAYSIVWLWIAMIAVIYGANYAVDGRSRNSICHVVAIWWTANISMTTLLNWINYRGVEEAGAAIAGLPGIVLDFIAQGALDIAALFVIWIFIRRGVINASVWTLIFCGYLVSNLYGHTSGAYNLMIGVNPEIAAQSYDAYMYLVFTIMLVLQTLGAGGDALLRWGGVDVDLYVDIRPIIHRFAARHLHLF